MAELDKYTLKAVEDPEFRKRVLEDANKAIKEEFGEEPPYKVTYHVSDSKHIVFTLPPDYAELDEDTLENVAGGKREVKKEVKIKGIPGIMAYACFPTDRF